jgi:CRP-like cAMP-binding protein
MLIPEAVRSSYLFKGLRPDQIDSVLALSQEKMFTGGEILVRQFEQSQDLLVILSGEVRVKGFQGEDLATLGAGSVLGEISLVDCSPRSATVISKGETMAAIIPAAKLLDLMARDTEVKAMIFENLSKLLCSRLRNSNIQLDAALNSRGSLI